MDVTAFIMAWDLGTLNLRRLKKEVTLEKEIICLHDTILTYEDETYCLCETHYSIQKRYNRYERT